MTILTTTSNAMNAPPSRNPYVGPRTFVEAEKDLFFGREHEARELLSLVISEPLVLFSAQSGAGKSSLLNTRLVPKLKEEYGFTVLPVGRVGGVPPSGIESIENIFTFNLLLSLDQQQTDPANLLSLSVPDYLQQYHAPTPTESEEQRPQTRVLIVDQFEEILTTHLDRWTERESFFYQLNEALRQDPYLWVVLTMRDDYVAALDPYLYLLTNRMRARYYMQRMTASEAKKAIEEPAQIGQRPFAPNVANKLINDLRQLKQSHTNQAQIGEFIEPVQLQVVCYQLWQNLQNKSLAPITAQDLEDIGDVDIALAQFYEQAIANVMRQTDVPELVLRNWFQQHLITKAQTRGTVNQGRQQTGGLDNHIVHLLDQQFILRAEQRAGTTWYELIHDRFIEPILTSNRAWQTRQSPLIRDAQTWERAGRPSKLLYKDEKLAIALSQNRGALPVLIQQFLRQSELNESEQRWEEAHRNQQEAIAQEQVEEIRSSRLTRLITTLLITTSIIVAVLALVSWNAQIGAESSEATKIIDVTVAHEKQLTAEAASTAIINEQDIANNAASMALASENTAVSIRASAEAAEAIAEGTRSFAETREAEAVTAQALAQANEGTAVAFSNEALTRQARAELAQQQAEVQYQLRIAQSLAIQALDAIQQSNDTELTLLLARQARNILDELVFPDDEASRILYAQERADVIADVERILLPVVNQPYFNTTLRGHEHPIMQIAFAATERLVSIDSSGKIILWNLSQPSASQEIVTGLTNLRFVSITPDGSTVAIADAENNIEIWPIWVPNPTPTRFTEPVPIVSMVVAPDGETLAVATSSVTAGGGLFWWNWDGDEPTRSFAGTSNSRGFLYLIFIPNSTRLIGLADVRNSSDILYEWRLNGGGNTLRTEYIAPLAFSANGRVVAYVQRDLSGAGNIPLANAFPAPQDFFTADTAVSTLQHPITLSGDGTQFIDVIENTSLRLWLVNSNARTAQIETLLTGQLGAVSAITISANNEYIASGSEDGTIRLWQRLDQINTPSQLLSGACQILKRNLTLEEWNAFLRNDPYRETCP